MKMSAVDFRGLSFIPLRIKMLPSYSAFPRRFHWDLFDGREEHVPLPFPLI